MSFQDPFIVEFGQGCGGIYSPRLDFDDEYEWWLTALPLYQTLSYEERLKLRGPTADPFANQPIGGMIAEFINNVDIQWCNASCLSEEELANQANWQNPNAPWPGGLCSKCGMSFQSPVDYNFWTNTALDLRRTDPIHVKKARSLGVRTVPRCENGITEKCGDEYELNRRIVTAVAEICMLVLHMDGGIANFKDFHQLMLFEDAPFPGGEWAGGWAGQYGSTFTWRNMTVGIMEWEGWSDVDPDGTTMEEAFKRSRTNKYALELHEMAHVLDLQMGILPIFSQFDDGIPWTERISEWYPKLATAWNITSQTYWSACPTCIDWAALGHFHAKACIQAVCPDVFESGGLAAKFPLDSYGLTHIAEFFAVATEGYFEAPDAFAKYDLQELYDLLDAYYKWDSINREIRQPDPCVQPCAIDSLWEFETYPIEGENAPSWAMSNFGSTIKYTAADSEDCFAGKGDSTQQGRATRMFNAVEDFSLCVEMLTNHEQRLDADRATFNLYEVSACCTGVCDPISAISDHCCAKVDEVTRLPDPNGEKIGRFTRWRAFDDTYNCPCGFRQEDPTTKTVVPGISAQIFDKGESSLSCEQYFIETYGDQGCLDAGGRWRCNLNPLARGACTCECVYDLCLPQQANSTYDSFEEGNCEEEECGCACLQLPDGSWTAFDRTRRGRECITNTTARQPFKTYETEEKCLCKGCEIDEHCDCFRFRPFCQAFSQMPVQACQIKCADGTYWDHFCGSMDSCFGPKDSDGKREAGLCKSTRDDGTEDWVSSTRGCLDAEGNFSYQSLNFKPYKDADDEWVFTGDCLWGLQETVSWASRPGSSIYPSCYECCPTSQIKGGTGGMPYCTSEACPTTEDQSGTESESCGASEGGDGLCKYYPACGACYWGGITGMEYRYASKGAAVADLENAQWVDWADDQIWRWRPDSFSKSDSSLGQQQTCDCCEECFFTCGNSLNPEDHCENHVGPDGGVVITKKSDLPEDCPCYSEEELHEAIDREWFTQWGQPDGWTWRCGCPYEPPEPPDDGRSPDNTCPVGMAACCRRIEVLLEFGIEYPVDSRPVLWVCHCESELECSMPPSLVRMEMLKNTWGTGPDGMANARYIPAEGSRELPGIMGGIWHGPSYDGGGNPVYGDHSGYCSNEGEFCRYYPWDVDPDYCAWRSDTGTLHWCPENSPRIPY